jgi:hypothetical protein
MFSDEIIALIAQAIAGEVANPLGSMHVLHAGEEQLAVAILNALDDGGYEIVKRQHRPAV